MTMAEMIMMVVVLVVCGAGLSWMFYDINKTLNQLEAIEAERCESKEDEAE